MTDSFCPKMTDYCRYYYKKIILEHNHTLAKSPSMTKQMGAQNMKEATMDDMIDTMHKVRVNHVKVMHILHESVGGLQNLSIMERDIQNRYSRSL
jgi:hypothetical protein